jgi:hypothetical protein
MQVRDARTAGVGMNKGHGSSKRPENKTSAQQPAETSRQIEDYRKCPVCHDGRGGYGVAYSTQGQTRYYRCCKSNRPDGFPCGHTWSVRVVLSSVVVEHKQVFIDGQR